MALPDQPIPVFYSLVQVVTRQGACFFMLLPSLLEIRSHFIAVDFIFGPFGVSTVVIKYLYWSSLDCVK